VLTEVVPPEVALVVVGIAVEELTRVVPGTGAREVVETPPGTDMVLVLVLTSIFRQG